MSIVKNAINSFKTFPQDVRELSKSFKEDGFKKTCKEKKDLIQKIALKTLASLTILLGAALLIALPFQVAALSGAGVAVASIVGFVAFKTFAVGYLLFVATLIADTATRAFRRNNGNENQQLVRDLA